MYRFKLHLTPAMKRLLGKKELSMTCIQNKEENPESYSEPEKEKVLQKLLYQATR